MVSKKFATVLVIIALLLAVLSIVVSISVSNATQIPGAEQSPNVNIIPDQKTGQVGLIINKPPAAP